jgi:hypothetical protein
MNMRLLPLLAVITFFLADIRTDAATVFTACAAVRVISSDYHDRDAELACYCQTFLAQLATQGLSFLCVSPVWTW